MVEEALLVADRIARSRATSIQGLAIKFDAVWWWLELDDSILDASAKRWLAGFRRSVRQLARHG